MRKSRRCPKCEHGEVLHVPKVMDSDFNQHALGVRMTLLMKREMVGALQAYVCLGCGFVEWYVDDAAAIEIKRLEGATVLRAPTHPAYR